MELRNSLRDVYTFYKTGARDGAFNFAYILISCKEIVETVWLGLRRGKY